LKIASAAMFAGSSSSGRKLTLNLLVNYRRTR
jgi:hypothetical protein